MNPLHWPRVVAVGTLLALAVAASAAADAWPAADWEVATPEEEGMDSRALAALVEFGSRAQMDSLVVARRGRIVAEAYWAPFQPQMKHRINSATKAVVGTLAGIAVEQGLLPASGPVLELLDPAAAADPARRAVTLQHLLDMTSGIEWVEPLAGEPTSMYALERSGDWVRHVLQQPMARTPGAAFDYNSGNSQLVSALIARRSGLPTEEFARRHLFGPIGIHDLRWRTDPQGVAIGGFGLYLRTRDMARLAHLALNEGEWNGRQVVPRAWARKVGAASVVMQPMTSWRYADGWWVLPQRQAYLASGYNRQVILVLPQLRVVAAVTGRGQYPLEELIDRIAGAVRSGEPLPADASARAALAQQVARAASDGAVAPPPGTLGASVSGRKWRLARNPLNLTELTLRFDGAGWYEVSSVDASGATRTVSSPLGLQGWVSQRPDAGGDAVFTRASWEGADTLLITARSPTEARELSYRMRFEGDRLEITYTPAVGRPMVILARPAP